MTPEERQLVDDLFDRIAKLESNPRDPDAERAIAEGLKRAPNAVYALVQTVLVQDEALRRADARIRELSEGGEPQEQRGSFLDTMRNALTGARTSVPSVRPGAQSGADPRWNQGGAMPGGFPGGNQYAAPPGAQPQGQPQGFGGGSFLGTAAASAAGVIGGSLLLNSISSMFGNRGSAFASTPSQSSPWDSGAGNSDLARDAGAQDVGGNRQSAFDDQQDHAFDDASVDPGFDDDNGGDFGDFGGDDSA